MKPPVFSCLTSRVTDNGSLYGRFLFGPLPIDISVTLATILRRSLLHSKSTFAIVSAEIEGANHEYASLPGVQESVLEILLNLAEIVLTGKDRNLLDLNSKSSLKYRMPLRPNSNCFHAFLRISGPCVVTAKDVNWPNEIYCVKPNAYIATLSANATLALRLKIRFFPKKQSTHAFGKGPSGQAFGNGLSVGASGHGPSIRASGVGLDLRSTGLRLGPKVTPMATPLRGTKPKDLGQRSHPKGHNPLVSGAGHKPIDHSTHNSQKNLKTLTESFGTISQHLLPNYRLQDLSGFSAFVSKGNTQIRLKRKSILVVGGFLRQTEGQHSKPSARLLRAYSSALSGLEGAKEGASGFRSMLQKNKAGQHSLPSVAGKADKAKGCLSALGPSALGPLGGPAGQHTEGPRPVLGLRPTVKDLQSTPLGVLEAWDPPEGSRQLTVSSILYPVEKVNFLIQRDDGYDGYRHRIIFEVWTNGSISPRQAIFDSIGWIIKLIYNFREPTRLS